MIAHSYATECLAPSTIMRAWRGSSGKRARARPTSVSLVSPPRPVVTAPRSVSSWRPSRIDLVSGDSTKGNEATSSGDETTPTLIMWSSTEASEVRKISGSVNAGLPSKSSSA